MHALVLIMLIFNAIDFTTGDGTEPASSEPPSPASPGAAGPGSNNPAPAAANSNASPAAPASSDVLQRNMPCHHLGRDGCAGENLTCINYGRMLPGDDKDLQVCDCDKPVDKECYCMADSVMYRRWVYQDKPMPTPKYDDEEIKVPKAGYSRPGCYLELGETCNLAEVDNEKADTSNHCRHSLHCKAIKGSDMWGFCATAYAHRSVNAVLEFVLLLGFSLCLLC